MTRFAMVRFAVFVLVLGCVQSFFAAGAAAQSNGAQGQSPTEAQARELYAGDDPLAKDEAARETIRVQEKIDRGTTVEPEQRTGFDLYGSLRLRRREEDGEGDWQDGGSRAGVNAEWQYREGSFLMGRYEAGFNLITGFEDLNSGKDSSEKFRDSVFTRLAYLGVDSPEVTATIGKNWSPYYKVASFTDRFTGTGASGSGAFNARTDGGPTGTGRADNVIQGKFSTNFLPHAIFKPFDVNVQLQYGNPIPFAGEVEYDGAIGFSAVMETHRNLAVGLAYNHAGIDIHRNPSLRKIGIDGDSRALLLGVRGFGDQWYTGIVLGRYENHETTDQGTYFNGWGSELYAQRQLSNRWWLVGGYNALEPDSDQDRAGSFRVRYAVLGVRYAFDGFGRMVYANIRFEDGMEQNGGRPSNAVTIGVRWDLSKRGWHLSSRE